MIIQARGRTALLITQPDHAALAGRIMSCWKHHDFDNHPRRASVLLAVAEHDNGWQEVDAAPVLDPATGRMLDFVDVPAETRRAIWPRGVDRLSRRSNDPWAAALVAQHAVHVYRHYREDPGWTRFFTEMEAVRDKHLGATVFAPNAGAPSSGARTSLSLDDLLGDYFFVRMGDLLSLTFCNSWAHAPDELGYAIGCDGDRLTVRPDPFDGQEVMMEVPARTVANAFTSAAAAAEAFSSAHVSLFRGVCRGASEPEHA